MDINTRYINESTKLFKIVKHPPIIFTEPRQTQYSKMAEAISKETGVPPRLIYETRYGIDLHNKIKNWYKINDIWYYYKNVSGKTFINELIGEIVSEYFDIDTIHYQIAQLIDSEGNSKIGLISENFCDLNTNYRTLDYYEKLHKFFFWKYDSLPETFNKLKTICLNSSNYLQLASSIKKLYIRDFSTSETDRSKNNILFKDDGNSVMLGTLYDYEETFTDDISIIPVYISDIGKMDVRNPYTQLLLREDPESQKLLELLMTMDINQIMSQTEQRHNIVIPEYAKQEYIKHNNRVKKIVMENNLLKN